MGETKMSDIFGGGASAGPVGSNISDYTSLPNAPGMQGMGPIASGQQYGQFLQSQQQVNPLESLGNFLGDFGKQRAQERQQQQQQPQANSYVPMQPLQLMQPQRPQVQLQQANLMDFLSMIGGR